MNDNIGDNHLRFRQNIAANKEKHKDDKIFLLSIALVKRGEGAIRKKLFS